RDRRRGYRQAPPPLLARLPPRPTARPCGLCPRPARAGRRRACGADQAHLPRSRHRALIPSPPMSEAPLKRTEDHPAIAEAKRVLEVESAAILGLIEHLDHVFIDVVELMNACAGRVVTMGLGKSGIICKKISATLASTGTPSF